MSVEYHPAVERELVEVRDYYEKRSRAHLALRRLGEPGAAPLEAVREVGQQLLLA